MSDTIRQIIRGTKEKREKKDKEMEAACLISSANGGNINTVAPSATKSSNTTSAAVTSISATPLSTPGKLYIIMYLDFEDFLKAQKIEFVCDWITVLLGKAEI